MADDINSYALNLAFQLKAAPAIASLHDVLSAITNIQDGIQRVSTALAGPVVKSLTFIQEQFTKVVASSVDMSKNTTKLEADLAAIQQHYEEIDRLTTKTSKINLKAFLDFDKIRKWTTQLLKEQKLISVEIKAQAKQQEQISNAVKASYVTGGDVVDQADTYAGASQHIAAIWQGINTTGGQSVKQGKSQVAIGEQVAAAWANTNGAMGSAADKGKEHIGIGGMVAAAWTKASKSVQDTVVEFASMLIGIQAIKAAFAGFVDEEVRFSTANYRLYGQQTDIIKQVNRTQLAYGLMRKQVLEAYTAIGASVRTNKDDLDKMVRTNVEFSLILGVNQKDLGAWQRSMMGIGIGVKEGRALLSHYTTVMREMGMTAQQLSKILGEQSSAATDLNFLYGSEGTTRINSFTTSLGGLANALNIGEAAASEMQSSLSKALTENAIILKSQSTLTQAALDAIPPAEQEAAKALSGAGSLVRQAIAEVNRFDKTTKKGMEMAEVSVKAYASVLKVTPQAMKNLMRVTQEGGASAIDVWGKTGDALVAVAGKTKDLARAQAAAKGVEALIAYDREEQARSLAQQFDQSISNVHSAWSNMMAALKPAFMWLLNNIITPLINAVTWVLNLLSGFEPVGDKTADALNKVSKTAEPVVGWFDWMGKTLKSVVFVIGGLVVAIGAIGLALTGLVVGIALWKAFMNATDATKLIAIAIAAVAVGAGFLMLSVAFANMARLGWAIIGPLVAVVVVLGLLTVALIALGTLGWLGVAAAIALAIAFVGLGFAALEVSWAFQNVVKALVELYDVTGGAWGLVGLGIALLAFGVALIAAAVAVGTGAALMALATIPLVVAMTGLSLAMFMISDSAIEKLESLSDGRLQKFGDALSSAAPGIATFIESMGTGFKFSLGMRGLASGLNRLDPDSVLTTAQALMILGNALEKVSKFNIDNLPNIGTSLLTFANSLAETFDALTAAVNRAVISVAMGLFSITFVVWQLQSQITGAFTDLLAVIPTITSVTNAIADAIESGHDKITNQIDAMQTSFAILESIATKMGVPTTVEEDKKKVMAETVSTIQVKSETSGSVTARWKQEEEQEKQTMLMKSISESVEKITGGNIEDVKTIRTLLQTYLPKMGESPSKLSTRLNNWS